MQISMEDRERKRFILPGEESNRLRFEIPEQDKDRCDCAAALVPATTDDPRSALFA